MHIHFLINNNLSKNKYSFCNILNTHKIIQTLHSNREAHIILVQLHKHTVYSSLSQ